MDEPLWEMIAGRPPAQLTSLAAGYVGYRIEGAPPGMHRGLPSRHPPFIVTLDSTVHIAAMPDPTQPPGHSSHLSAACTPRRR
jgi:hypothetical protein